jgi:nucleotide sugar dehydrogenase
MPIMNLSKQAVMKAVKNGKLKVCVIGLGRIGLPTAAMFAKAGAQVIGADTNSKVVQLVNSGRCQFKDEPNLENLVETVVKTRNLKATVDVSTAVKQADVILICVSTPVDENKVPDYSQVKKACLHTAKSLRKGSLVIIESTVGPGTVENLVVPLLEKKSKMKAGIEFGVASCPERADPGNIIQDLKSIPRIIGGINTKSADVAAALYRAVLGVGVVKVSNPKTANAVKLTENLFRDVNIALANEFAILYEKLGIDTIEVIEACSTKYNFMPHYPGAGVGGPCLPQNPYYLIVEGIKVGNIPYLVRLAREINDRMPEHVVTLITRALNTVGKTVQKSKIALLGISYKPGIRDIQLTPMEKVFYHLKNMGASIKIYDPLYREEKVFGVKTTKTLNEAIKEADCIVIGTAHKEFFNINLAAFSKLCNMPAAFVDTRHVITRHEAEKRGFAYLGIGRP